MTQTAVATLPQRQSPFAIMASRLNIDEAETKALMTNTLMKAKGNGAQVSNEELVTFLAIANEYSLNPLTKEIYAFNNRGAIQPIVSIDGWLKIINQHPQFDGMEFEDTLDNDGSLSAITCRIYRKDRNRPTEVTEYLSECADKSGKSDPWKRWPARMLRHKATIQAARYAFGLSGIVDPDEAERIEQTQRTERDVTPATSGLSAKLGQAPQQQEAVDIQSAVPADELLKHLPACASKADLDEWKQDAMKWPEGSNERNKLVQAYNEHCSNLKHAAQQQ